VQLQPNLNTLILELLAELDEKYEKPKQRWLFSPFTPTSRTSKRETGGHSLKEAVL
jgi:hypothetical protein